MKATFKLNTRKWAAAASELASLAKKKPVQEVMRSAAGSVIKTVVGLTPPAKSAGDSQARQRGESAILFDILRIAVPVSGPLKKAERNALATSAEMEAVYLASLVRGAGVQGHRVNPRNRKNPLLVSQQTFNAFLRDHQKRVGFLAAGWNAAATELKVRLPAWIKRHGDSQGFIRITVTQHGMRITVANTVRYADQIPDMERRLQWAVDSEAKLIIQKKIPNAIKQVAKKAGFKVR